MHCFDRGQLALGQNQVVALYRGLEIICQPRDEEAGWYAEHFYAYSGADIAADGAATIAEAKAHIDSYFESNP